MDLESAKAIALEQLRNSGADTLKECLIVDEYTRETPASWIFIYESKKWFETRNSGDRLLGTIPILVDKASGMVRGIRRTSDPLEVRIAKVEADIRSFLDSRPKQ